MSSEPGLLTEVIGLPEKPTDRYYPSAEMRCLSGAPGSTTYRDRELRSFFCRLVGWADEVTALVDDMMHTLLSAVARRTPIVLRGESDLIPVAHALHRRLFDSDRPFVVCDPRRCEGDGSVRTPPNRRTGMLALETAMHGSVCVRSNRLPPDFDAFTMSLREEGSPVMLFVCLHDNDRIRDLLCPPIEIPSLAQREHDLERILDECLKEAAEALGVRAVRLSVDMRRSVLGDVRSLSDLEKATVRLVALMSARNLSQAAERLHMAPVSLSRWVRRRRWSAALLRGAEECTGDADSQ